MESETMLSYKRKIATRILEKVQYAMLNNNNSHTLYSYSLNTAYAKVDGKKANVYINFFKKAEGGGEMGKYSATLYIADYKIADRCQCLYHSYFTEYTIESIEIILTESKDKMKEIKYDKEKGWFSTKSMRDNPIDDDDLNEYFTDEKDNQCVGCFDKTFLYVPCCKMNLCGLCADKTKKCICRKKIDTLKSLLDDLDSDSDDE